MDIWLTKWNENVKERGIGDRFIFPNLNPSLINMK